MMAWMFRAVCAVAAAVALAGLGGVALLCVGMAFSGSDLSAHPGDAALLAALCAAVLGPTCWGCWRVLAAAFPEEEPAPPPGAAGREALDAATGQVASWEPPPP